MADQHPTVEALKRELSYCKAQGDKVRAKLVEEQLAARGEGEKKPAEKKAAAPKERAVRKAPERADEK